MSFEDLERLLHKESYPILIINGDQPKIPLAAEQLRSLGYVVEQVQGPDLTGCPRTSEINDEVVKPLLNATGDFFRDLQTSAHCGFLNYGDTDQERFMMLIGRGHASRDGFPNRFGPISDEINETENGLKAGMANRFYHSQGQQWQRRTLLANAITSVELRSNLDQVRVLLQRMSNDPRGSRHPRKLKKVLKKTYESVMGSLDDYMGTHKELPLSETAYRLSGIYQIVFGDPLEGCPSVEDLNAIPVRQKPHINHYYNDLVDQQTAEVETKLYSLPTQHDIAIFVDGQYIVANVDITDSEKGARIHIDTHESTPIGVDEKELVIRAIVRRGVPVVDVQRKNDSPDFMQAIALNYLYQKAVYDPHQNN